MEEAYELGEFLPLSFRTKSEQEYVSFLWDAYETNYKAGKFQFAFLAYHMLTMAVIYFNIWQIRHTRSTHFEMAMVGFKEDESKLLNASTPFAFHIVKESTVVRFLKLIGCDNSQCGNYADLVKARNSTAHCNGSISPADEASLAKKVTEVLRVVEEIQAHSRPVIEECYRQFLLESSEPEEREYTDPTDQIKEVLVHGKYMSSRDIEICRDFDLSVLASDANFDAIKVLHNALCVAYPASDANEPGTSQTALSVPPTTQPSALPSGPSPPPS